MSDDRIQRKADLVISLSAMGAFTPGFVKVVADRLVDRSYSEFANLRFEVASDRMTILDTKDRVRAFVCSVPLLSPSR